ncbi:MAG: hypothetical protein NVS3B7_13230 [Candidatus Elarobacter sp.]
MDVLPVKPAPPHRPRPSPAVHAAKPLKAHAAAVHAPPSPEELELLAQQAQFDLLMQARAEGEREANALRDLALEQLKHDDSAMHAWIKMI